MDGAEVPETNADVIKRELFARYMHINDGIGVLRTLITKKRINRFNTNMINTELKKYIIQLVGVATLLDQHFYIDIEDTYTTFCNEQIEANTTKKIKYNSETIIEMWEIIKIALIEHKIASLND